VLLGLSRLHRGFRKERLGSLREPALTYRIECIYVNVGGLSQDAKVNRPPMPYSEVGGSIVVGG
jgi:hypothetical protein